MRAIPDRGWPSSRLCAGSSAQLPEGPSMAPVPRRQQPEHAPDPGTPPGPADPAESFERRAGGRASRRAPGDVRAGRTGAAGEAGAGTSDRPAQTSPGKGSGSADSDSGRRSQRPGRGTTGGGARGQRAPGGVASPGAVQGRAAAASGGRAGPWSRPAPAARPARPYDPRRQERRERSRLPLDEDVRADELDSAVRRDLGTLAAATADLVARHLVVAGRLLGEDPTQALAHAQAAGALAGRVAAVWEATGLAAYAAGQWAIGLGELRAARRLRRARPAPGRHGGLPARSGAL